MILGDLRLLNIDLYDEDKLVFSGTTEEVPEEYKEKEILIMNQTSKKIICKIKKEDC